MSLKSNLQIWLLIIASTSVVLLSCERTNEKEEMLAKKWVYEKVVINGMEQNLIDLGNPSVELKEDGTYSASFGGEAETGTWSMEGDTVVVRSEMQPQAQLMVIKELSEKKLVVDALTQGLPADIETIEFTLIAATEVDSLKK